MARFIGVLTQSGADTTINASIDTGITVDGKTGIAITACEVQWDNGETAVAADWEMNFIICTTSTSTVFSSPDEIARVSWGMQNTAGVAVATSYDPIKDIILLEPRVTVQPLIYVYALSTATGQANILRYKVYYDVVKLTDLEVMRLLVGGA